MNLKKMFNRKTKAGITAYVMLMFGMIVILYLFGFTSAWGNYEKQQISDESGSKNITDVDAVNKDIGTLMIDNIKALFTNEKGETDLLRVVIGTALTLAGMYLASKVGGQYAFAYIIPIIFVILFANIFIFPISYTSEHLGFASDIPLSLFLIAFFNLFLVLSIVEFVRGGSM